MWSPVTCIPCFDIWILSGVMQGSRDYLFILSKLMWLFKLSLNLKWIAIEFWSNWNFKSYINFKRIKRWSLTLFISPVAAWHYTEQVRQKSTVKLPSNFMLFSLARNELIIYWKKNSLAYSWKNWLHFRAPSHFQVGSKLSKKTISSQEEVEPCGRKGWKRRWRIQNDIKAGVLFSK
jgi:hypothetical protein